MSTLLCPLDGRYAKFTDKYRETLSESAYIRDRVRVEVKYLEALLEELHGDTSYMPIISKYEYPSEDDLLKIKEIEETTHHDVKAIEYYLKKCLREDGVPEAVVELVHVGLTSQDVNSVGFMMGFRRSIHLFMEDIVEMVSALNNLIGECHVPVLTKTHGQPAVPSYLDKELYVYVYRVYGQFKKLSKELPQLTVKFGGAIGNFNAHYLAFPSHNWLQFADTFVEKMSFVRSQFTKQIDNYESIASTVDLMRRIMVILNDLQNNLWLYISDNYFRQKVIATEVGSSTMPHKVNPIHFENARGNIELFLKIASVYSESLPVSQYQRDLKDSTLLRSMGLLFGYGSLVLGQLTEGIHRLSPNLEVIQRDLEDNVVVIMEGLQTRLKIEPTIANAYQLAKDFSRTDRHLTLDQIHTEFIDKLPISTEVKSQLKQVTVFNYVGVVPPMTLLSLDQWTLYLKNDWK